MLKGYSTLRAENERFRAALALIAAFEGKTLIAPSLGEDCNRAYQLGAVRAFDQASAIAADALATDITP